MNTMDVSVGKRTPSQNIEEKETYAKQKRSEPRNIELDLLGVGSQFDNSGTGEQVTNQEALPICANLFIQGALVINSGPSRMLDTVCIHGLLGACPA
jgi:hypothetical protein